VLHNLVEGIILVTVINCVLVTSGNASMGVLT